MSGRQSFLDGAGARIVAGVIALVSAAVLLWANWHLIVSSPPEKEDDAKLNPQFVACRDQRLTTVNKVKDDGVINDAQYKQFAERAIATCAGQFPPGGNTQ